MTVSDHTTNIDRMKLAFLWLLPLAGTNRALQAQKVSLTDGGTVGRTDARSVGHRDGRTINRFKGVRFCTIPPLQIIFVPWIFQKVGDTGLLNVLYYQFITMLARVKYLGCNLHSPNHIKCDLYIMVNKSWSMLFGGKINYSFHILQM